jgi:hypothetical protein
MSFPGTAVDAPRTCLGDYQEVASGKRGKGNCRGSQELPSGKNPVWTANLNQNIQRSGAWAAVLSGGERALICYHTRSGTVSKEFAQTSPTLNHLVGTRDAELGQFREAILSAEKALNLAGSAGDREFVQKINHWLELCK